MFTGRRYDDETGLYYYRNRYYDSETGRFLQPDPIGYKAGLNLYTYVGNNSVNWVDPYGLKKAPVWHTRRNIFNKCPEKKPKPESIDECGDNPNPWMKDRWSWRYHRGRQCYRRADKTGVGGSQCCYFYNGKLDDWTDKMGTYDYVSPTWNPITWWGHRKKDVRPHHNYGGGYVVY